MPRNRKYPHLLPVDVPVWERFLEKHAVDYDYIEYDIRVGEGRDPGDAFDKSIRSMAVSLSQRRIDAVGHRADQIDIIEITTLADLRALGQMHLYPVLYKQTFGTNVHLNSVLVAAELTTDLIHAIRESNINLRLFP